jgi:ribose/xylose/arabinose/galactoside ABC-type transport system permease subunit
METQIAPKAPLPMSDSKPLFSRIPRMQEMGLLIVIAVMWGILSFFGYRNADPGQANQFLNPPNLIEQIGTPMSYYAIMAVGMTMVIISGGIDISVASTMALSALAGAAVLQYLPPDAPGWKVLPLAFIIPPLVGLLCGLVNGALVVLLEVHPFIISLGTLSIFRWLAIRTHQEATLPSAGRTLPVAFTEHFMNVKIKVGADSVQAMPLAITVLVVVVGWFYLSKTIGGREIYALGGNEEASRFSGLRIHWIKLRVYAVAGFTAGIAGMVSLGHFGSAASNTALGYELTVVAAAVVGGASLTGGRGTALGAFLGAVILASIEDGIYILHGNTADRLGITGGAIILAVALDRFNDKLRQRRIGRRA